MNLYSNAISDMFFSVAYVYVQALAVYFVWIVSEKKIGLFLLFQFTFSLFIGGRFIACLLGWDEDLFQTNFFCGYIVLPDRKVEIVAYVLIFVVFSTVGYCKVRNKKNIKPWMNISISDNMKEGVAKLSNLLFPIFCVYILYDSISLLREAFSGAGYLVRYENQTADYSGGGKLISNVILFFFSFSFICNDSLVRIKYLVLYLVNSFIILLVGSRGAIGAMFLFLIWLYSLNHKVDLKKMAIYALLSLILLLYAFSFSIRTEDIDFVFTWKDLYNLILDFIYSNGGSLMVFDVTRIVDGYPMVGFIQTFLPGASYIWSVLTGTVRPEELTFTAYLCNELNPVLYASGYGLGWSVLSDIYLFSFYGNFIIYAFISFLGGYLMAILENLAECYTVYRFFLIYIFMATLLLPRGLLAGVVNMFVYALVFLFMFKILFVRSYHTNSSC